MKTLAKSLIFAVLAACSVAFAADFPKGSPVFEHKLSTAIARAKAEGKPVVAVFSAVWCGPCQQMKKEVYPSAEVKKYHDKFVWAYLDTDDESNGRDAAKFGVSGIPHIQFLDKNGKAVDKQVGSSSPDEFASTLKAVLKKAGGSEETANKKVSSPAEAAAKGNP
jgi:thioredoxin-like negative regulator of GroEL